MSAWPAVDGIGRVVLARSVLSRVGRVTGCRGGQAHDVALEFRARYPAAAADVNGTQLTGLHEGVNGRATDAEERCSFLGCHEKRVVGQHVPK
jgi:hypothetical protein